ncbi:MAG: glutaredoxin family protein [Betaproteobacteria bacterium]|nr:MAG: glutaredoxin family protein [Betaproteobacteria bacterium]
MGSVTCRPRAALGIAVLLGIVTATVQAQTQQVYRYIDVDGRVVYSDKPPPPTAKEAQAKRVGANSIETSALSFATQQAQERYPVTLYSFGCGVICDTAQGVLNKRGVPHTVVDVGQSDGADKLKKLTGGLDAPALQVGDQYAVGFNETRWQGMLSDAGYPKTPPPRNTPVGRVPGPATPEPTPVTQTAQPTLPPKGGYPQ